MKLTAILSIVFCTSLAEAQCPSRENLRLALANGRMLKEVSQRFEVLQSLRCSYRQCRYHDDSTYSQLLNNLASLCFRISDLAPSHPLLDSADQYLNEALLIAAKNPTVVIPNELANTYYFRGVLYQATERLPEAVLAFDKAITIGLQQKRTGAWIYSYVLQAIDYARLGDYQRSFDKATLGAAFYKEPRDQAQCMGIQAQALYALGRSSEAVPLLMNAIRIIRGVDADDYDLADYYLLLGDLQQEQGHYRQAENSYWRALPIFQKHQDPQGVRVYNEVGFLCASGLNEPVRAKTYFLTALRTSPSAYQRARSCLGLGVLSQRAHRYTDALQWFQKGLTTMPLGFSNSDVRKNPAALTIRLAADKPTFLMLIQHKADTWLANAKGPTHQRSLTHALETYKVADQMIDFMRWEHTGQQSKLYWRDKTRAMYERAIETCYRLGNAEQAFRFLEKSRAVMLADKLNELGARQLLAPKQLAQEQALNQRVADRQARLASISPDSAAYSKAHAELLLEQDRLDTFRKTLEASNPDYYRYKYDSTTTALSDVRKYLKKQGGSLVTYFVGDSALYILNVTADRATLHRKPVDPYNRIAYAFMPLLSSPDNMNRQFGKFLTLSHGLYQQLLAPLKLPAGRVIVSPDGFFLPFEALSRSAQQPDYAVKDYAFSYAYSAGLLLKNRTHSPSLSPVGDFLGVAPVQFSPAMNQLALINSDNFLETIAGRFRQARLLTHENATRRAFQTDVAGYRVVHLFTHAIADSTEREPLLYFADSTLRLSELGDNGLPNAQLVVLAACKTGIGANQRGEGVFSLGRGFAALGVPSVMTTLWSVQNEATYRLTELFYKYLYEGEPKDIALQRAKQDWLKTAEGADQLPNFWAGLILVGNAEPLHQPNRWPWLAGLGLAIVIGLAGWRTWQNRRPKQTTQRAYQSS